MKGISGAAAQRRKTGPMDQNRVFSRSSISYRPNVSVRAANPLPCSLLRLITNWSTGISNAGINTGVSRANTRLCILFRLDAQRWWWHQELQEEEAAAAAARNRRQRDRCGYNEEAHRLWRVEKVERAGHCFTLFIVFYNMSTTCEGVNGYTNIIQFLCGDLSLTMGM